MKKQGTAKPDIKSSPTKTAEFMSPSVGLLVKLGSIIVHADEFTSPQGHAFDLHTLRQLLEDPEVKTWIEAGTRSALLPLKRSAR